MFPRLVPFLCERQPRHWKYISLKIYLWSGDANRKVHGLLAIFQMLLSAGGYIDHRLRCLLPNLTVGGYFIETKEETKLEKKIYCQTDRKILRSWIILGQS